MTYVYEGPASSIVSGTYLGAAPVELSRSEQTIALKNGVGLFRAEVRLEGPIKGDHLHITLPDGVWMSGGIVEDEPGHAPGWLVFCVTENNFDSFPARRP